MIFWYSNPAAGGRFLMVRFLHIGLSLCFSWCLLTGVPGAAAEPLRVITLGDSITKGVRTGVIAEETFAAELQRQVRVSGHPEAKVINVGIGGEMAGQGLKRLERDVISQKPAIVTIMYGHNDSYVDAGKTEARVSISRFRADLSQLVQRLREAGITPILMTPPAYAEKSGPNGIGEHCNVKLAQYAEVALQVAETLQVPLVDHYAAWSTVSKGGTDLNEWTTDGYHPNPRGHVEMAGRMLPVVARNMEEHLAIHSETVFPIWSELKVEGAVASRRFGPYERLLFQQITAEVTQIRFPRLNNVVRYVTLNVPGQSPSVIPLTQGPTEWTIAVPAHLPTGATVRVVTDGMPRLCERPAVSRPGADGTITLSARDAIVHGEKLQFEPLTHKNTVGYWVNPDDYAEWSYALDAPGEFDVEIMQGCGGHAGSDVELGFPEGAVPFVVEETGHFQNFVWRKIGKISLKESGVQTMSLKCKKLAKGAVMDMRQVRLIPVNVENTSPRDMRDVSPDLVPPLTHKPGDATPGRKMALPVQSVSANTLYLPTNWNQNQKWPILVELPGNWSDRNDRGDDCSGMNGDGALAFGLSGGYGAICLSVPFLSSDGKSLMSTWWGDPPMYDAAPTIANLKAVIAETCEKYNGDPNRVILVGFDRGSIAVNAVGLSSDHAAGRWKAAVCFSHYDGVGNWAFAKSDAASAIERLKRLGSRPQFIISESPADGPALSDQAKEFIEKSGVQGDFTFATTGFLNHSDQWALRPSPARTQLREWLAKQMQP